MQSKYICKWRYILNFLNLIHNIFGGQTYVHIYGKLCFALFFEILHVNKLKKKN